MNETLLSVEQELGIKFVDVAHYSYRNENHTFCGIPKIELLGFRFPLGGSGKPICERCKSLKESK